MSPTGKPADSPETDACSIGRISGVENPVVDALESLVRQEGFSMFGIAPAVEPDGFHRLIDWIDAGYAGSMDYIPRRVDAYRHPSAVLPGVKSLVMLAMPYPGTPPNSNPANSGRIARYAWPGTDYHDVIHRKLKRICRFITQSAGVNTDGKITARGVVDTAPLLEREFASLAGLGWQGKNTLLINKHAGSYFVLACVLTTLDLPPSRPHTANHCGTCSACLDACPTEAFPAPGVLDARRCISYLTIENRDTIPESLRARIGSWTFGCDICQEVCPWNAKSERRRSRNPPDADAPRTSTPQNESTPQNTLERLGLPELFALDEAAFRSRFRKTPLWRTRRRGVLRNAAIVLGNLHRNASPCCGPTPTLAPQQFDSRDEATAALALGIRDDDAMVREVSAWAIGEIAPPSARDILSAALMHESDRSVQEQLRRSLERIT